MASKDPDDIFSYCKVCKKKTTKATILRHMSISKDDKHDKFKKSEDYRNLENAIKKAMAIHQTSSPMVHEHRKEERPVFPTI